VTWANVREQIGNWLEVEQYDLVAECEATCKAITNFLGLDSKASEAFYQTVLNTQPERSAPSYEPLKFANLNWDAAKKEIFIRELDEVMKLHNYGYESYLAS